MTLLLLNSNYVRDRHEFIFFSLVQTRLHRSSSVASRHDTISPCCCVHYQQARWSGPAFVPAHLAGAHDNSQLTKMIKFRNSLGAILFNH